MAIGTASLLMAGGGFSAASSMIGGEMQASAIEKQAKYNSTVYGQQAEMIKAQKNIQDVQFNRQAASARGSIIAQTAGKGLALSGSPLAILIDNETNMQFDKAIADYNLDIERNYALSAAENTRVQGANDAKAARFGGYSNGFLNALNAGAQVGILKSQNSMGGKTIFRPSYPTNRKTYHSPYGNTYKY